MPGPYTRRSYGRFLQLLVAGAAFIYVISLVDFADAIHALAGLQLSLVPLAVAGALLGLVAAAARWQTLLQGIGVSYRLGASFRCYLAGSFYGLAMPGVIGGDLSRVVICRRETGADLGLVTATVLLERCLGVVVLFCLLALGLSLGRVTFLPSYAAPLAIAAAVAGVCVTFSFPLLLRMVQGDRMRRLSRIRLFAKIPMLLAAAGRYRKAQLARGLMLTAAFQLADLLVTFIIGRALGVELGLPALLVALPLAYLATALPISPAGLGLREATFAFTLSHAGVSASAAGILALCVFAVRFLVGMLGGADQLVRGARTANDRDNWSPQ